MEAKDLPDGAGLKSAMPKEVEVSSHHIMQEDHEKMAEVLSETADEKATKNRAIATIMKFEGNSGLAGGFFHIVE